MRGFWYIVESIIAGIIIITFLVTIGQGLMRAQVPDDVQSDAYEILKGLDDQGLLRTYAIYNDNESLANEISFYRYNYSVQICDPDGICVGSRPSAENVWIGSYFISGDFNYTPKEVKLYLWEQ